MANRLRLRSGQVHLAKLRVDSGTVLSAGDMVYLDDDDVKPASAFPWSTNLGVTQGAFAANFLGVVHEQSAAGETTPVSVDLSPFSVYEFDVAAGAYEVGDELGPDEHLSTLMNQQLEAVSTGTLGIARSCEYRTSGATSLRVMLASAYFTGSSNVNASIG